MPRILPTADQALISACQFAVESLGLPPKSMAGGEVSERTVYRVVAGEASGVHANHWWAVLRALPLDIQANVLASLQPELHIHAPPDLQNVLVTTCDRIGQTRDVHIYRLVSSSTVEENILIKARQKRHLDFLVMTEGNFSEASLFSSQGLKDIFGVSGDNNNSNEPSSSSSS